MLDTLQDESFVVELGMGESTRGSGFLHRHNLVRA